MQFSRRANVAGESNEYSKAVERARARGESLCDLTLSNPTQANLPYEAEEIALALSDATSVEYDPVPLGASAARNAVASLWAARNVSVAPDQVLLTSGTSEAYGFLFKLLCDPGDEVLVPEPSYPLFSELARYDSVTLKPYRLGFDGAYHIDFASVQEALGAKTKAVISVSPNNPTGTYTKPEEWGRLFQLGVPVISDEVFSAYTLTATRHPSALELAQEQHPEQLVFVLDGLSKYAGLPQVKLGWVTAVGPKAHVSAAMRQLEFIADAYLSVGSQAQRALPRLLQVSHLTRNAVLSRIHRNLACATARASGSPISVHPVEGGWSVPIRMPDILSDNEWAIGLLNDRGILTQPGWFYDFSEPAILVLSLLAPERQFEQGISQLLAYVDDRIRQHQPSHRVAGE